MFVNIIWIFLYFYNFGVFYKCYFLGFFKVYVLVKFNNNLIFNKIGKVYLI